jgi:hypothetical protein
LLSEAFGAAPDVRVVRAAGVESEMELPYAGLQQLCISMLDHLEHLPQPQADALRTAFGLIEGPAPDRFLVGLAVLSLLSEAAAQRPLVCVVDDCQWLDRASAQALAFAARRIQAEGVLLTFAAREPGQDFEGIPRFGVEGLKDLDARALLRSAVPWPLDEQVRERILAETRGNPLALLELPRGLSPAELAGGFGLPQELSQDYSLAGRIQESFLRAGWRHCRRRRGSWCCSRRPNRWATPPSCGALPPGSGSPVTPSSPLRKPGCSRSAGGSSSAIRSSAPRYTGRRHRAIAAGCMWSWRR